VNRKEIQFYLDHEAVMAPGGTCTLPAADLFVLCRLALRALKPARVICPSPRQDCEGCPHGIEHDHNHGDCEALDGCPACVEVGP